MNNDQRFEDIVYIVEIIDGVFGEGYAKKNPELVGRMAQAAALVDAALVLRESRKPLQ
jgi:hypothetical protein